jgi:hypothetical protein
LTTPTNFYEKPLTRFVVGEALVELGDGFRELLPDPLEVHGPHPHVISIYGFFIP